MADPVPLIQATLAPIFLVSGAAIFLNFTQARLFRVVDRLRGIGAELKSDDTTAERRAELLQVRGRNFKRAIVLRNSIFFGVLVIGWTVVTTLLILVRDVSVKYEPTVAPLITFSLALISFAVALILVTVDAFLSVAHARHIAQEFHEGLRPGEA